jgi:aminoglycoside phosphotransferase (APT) family kinase protein
MAETTGDIENAAPSAEAPAPRGSPQTYLGEIGEISDFAQIDEGRLHAYLREHLPELRGPLKVRQFQGGQSNLTYLLETPKAKYVLRRQPPGVLLKSAHAVDREFRVITALARVPDFPVPEPLVMCEDREILGSMFYVMSHVPGRVFWDCRMPGLSTAERAAVFDSANETLARLHCVDYASLGLADFGRPGNYFERQISRWSQQYEQSRTQDIPEMDRLMEWLPAFVPSDNGRSSIIHGDYSFHNLLIHPVEPRVVGVVDWELSTLGHPLGDLMYHAMEWYRPAGVDARGTLQDADLAALGIPTLERYIERYCERAGLVLNGDLLFYRAYNLFRTAAILQGIAHRLQEGNAASANAAEIAAHVRPLAKAAWRFAQEGGAVG